MAKVDKFALHPAQSRTLPTRRRAEASFRTPGPSSASGKPSDQSGIRNERTREQQGVAPESRIRNLADGIRGLESGSEARTLDNFVAKSSNKSFQINNLGQGERLYARGYLTLDSIVRNLGPKSFQINHLRTQVHFF